MGKLAIVLAGHLEQGPITDFQVIERGDFLRGGQIKAGLRFVGIGNRGCAHFEAALRRGELFGNRSLLRPDEFDIVFGLQYIEIGLGGAQDQILPGSL